MGIIRKLTVLCILLYLGINFQVSAETTRTSWTAPLHGEGSLMTSTPYKHVLPFGAYFDINYSIKRFSIHALIEGSYFLPKEGVTSNYNKTINLGGGVGFELFPRDENDKSVFEVRASVTRSLGSSDFRNTDYKVGIYWLAKPKQRCLAPIIGAGYSLNSFSNNNLHSYNGMFVSLGFRF